jgi:hypothetical protein
VKEKNHRARGWLVSLVSIGFVVTAVAGADTIRLKSGTVLEGTILAEDDQQITIEVQLAGGTITQREIVNKSDVVEITRLTEEEKAYRQIQRIQLDPNSSFPLAQYDSVINEVLRPFLTRYPDSPHSDEIKAKLAEWEAERQRVAGGKAKYRGQWMEATEAARLAQQDRTRWLLQQSRALREQGKFDQAMQQLRTIDLTSVDRSTADEVRRLESEIYDHWTEALRLEQQKNWQDIRACEERIGENRQAKYQADRELKEFQDRIKYSPRPLPAQDQTLSQLMTAAQRAGNELKASETLLAQLKEQQRASELRLAEVMSQQRLAASKGLPAQPAPASRPVAQAPATPFTAPSESPPPVRYRPGYEPVMPAPFESVTPAVPEEVAPVEPTKPAKIAMAPFFIGLAIAIIGGIWLLVKAFQESILWGVGVMFVPLVGLVFAAMHWSEAKWPFLINVAGWVIIFFSGVRSLNAFYSFLTKSLLGG